MMDVRKLNDCPDGKYEENLNMVYCKVINAYCPYDGASCICEVQQQRKLAVQVGKLERKISVCSSASQ